MEAANCSPQTGLSLVLQILHWLPSIPWDLSYHVGILTMFAYGPELYELQTWGATGDRVFHLDNHAWAANLLSDKLVHIHDRTSSEGASPSGVASPAGSVAPHLPTSSPARSHSRTPSHGTSLVGPAPTQHPAPVPMQLHYDHQQDLVAKNMKTPSQHPKMEVGPTMRAWLALVMKPLEMMNTKPVRVPTLQTPAVMSRKLRGLVVEQKGQPPRAAKVPQNPMVRCQSMQLHHQKRQKKTQPQNEPRQVLLAPPSCPLTLTARLLKQNRSVSNARMSGI